MRGSGHKRHQRPPATAPDPGLPPLDPAALAAFEAEAARLLAEFAAAPLPDLRTPLAEYTTAELQAELARRR